MIIRFYEYKRLIMHGSRPVTPVESSQQICKDLFDALSKCLARCQEYNSPNLHSIVVHLLSSSGHLPFTRTDLVGQ